MPQNRLEPLTRRLRPSVFGKIMFPTTFLVVACMSVMLVLRIRTQQAALFTAVQARGTTLASSLQSVYSESLYAGDFTTIINHALRILKANPDLHTILIRSDGDTVVLREDGYDFLVNGESVESGPNDRVHRIRGRLSKHALELGSFEVWMRLDQFDRQIASMYRLAVFELAASMILVLAACWFIAGRLADPIGGLERVMSQVAAGERSARAAVKGSDEIGRMAIAFNSMLDVLQKTEDSLVEVNQNLESRVHDRTEALSAANAGMSREIEQRKRVEADLRASEARYDLAVNGVNDGIWDWDLIADPEGRRIYHSSRFKQLLGYDVDETLERFDQWIHPNDLPDVQVAVDDHLGGVANGLDVEYRAVTRGGDVRWYRSRGKCTRDFTGRPLRIAGSLTDITPQKHSEQKMVELHREMLAMSRQAGMAEIASGVLHNVGNVLNSVCVSSQTVSETLESSRVGQVRQIANMLAEHAGDLAAFLTDDDRGRRIPRYLGSLAEKLEIENRLTVGQMDRIANKLTHIKSIVSRQQEYAKVGGLEESLDLVDAIEDAIRINQLGFDRDGIEIVRQFEDVPTIHTDKHKLLQILVNLLSNARAATTEFHPSDEASSKRVVIRLRREADNAVISVVDNGVGIAPENRDSIFSHGFTTKRDGHGFGLHSCALAVGDLGGSIRFDSDGIGRGASFTLEIPIRSVAEVHPV